jgi:hypothetical protein
MDAIVAVAADQLEVAAGDTGEQPMTVLLDLVRAG